ncbi:uncharacterized protein LACBIDRAFT_299738 [Laccaria bicolor S238N-H82]|uniref:Predicted protein n=1 Tax=Laccaria bicolor (strain S238N-H82 / ATCC MYA-4686) TaxID=486041 RepID=B0DFB7_LACBS|nr:uncharacterized protein LACBIDRAFT_299738 [Laccaria bicolor S238N-H82]EDR06835.1 predicted protein [Laccaria bicolor S238N-H82]|eukprot:XP_001882682.1 predicted protein [Laccaria bicolor S238N-H82]
MIYIRRDQRLFVVVAVVVFLLFIAALNNDHVRVSVQNKVPQWLKQSDPAYAGQYQPHEEDYIPRPHADSSPPNHHFDTIANTTAETVIPGGAHAPGFTVFDRLYLRAGIFYVVTADPSSWPPRRYLLAKPFEMGAGKELEPTDEDLQFIHPSKAKEILGEFAMRIPDFSVIVHDHWQFMKHYYHWWGEIILGFWRVYSHLAEGGGRVEDLPFPARFILTVIENDEWRDRAGVDGPFMRAVFPAAAIEKGDYWKDLIKLNTTVVFERSMLINRETAHRHPFGSKWYKMIAGTMNVTAPEDYWAPIRKALAENLLGYIPELDANGAVTGPTSIPGVVTTKPVVTYISRQGAGRRLTDKDHQALVEALRGLEKEGLCEVQIPMMERMSLADQIALPMKSTIIVGVHGNGLTHQLWMPRSERSTVIEIFDPPSYAFDYEMLARNMGHRHYGVQNDTLLTFPKNETHEGVHYTPGFHGNAIPVYAPAVAQTIRQRLTERIP